MKYRFAFACLLVVLVALSLSKGTAQEKSAAAPGALLRLELFVDDINRSASFYESVLGFKTDRREGDYIAERLGTVVLGLSAARELSANHYFQPELTTQRRGLGAEIVLEVPDVEAAFAAVKAAKCKVITGLKKRPWGQTDFRIADPNGYYLRISSH